jgi:ABC-type Fe3+/spermidine/putrescine transport system ATPase subunit
MTAYENVEFPLKIRGFSKKERRERVEEALEMVRLKGWEKQYPRQLSGGQQQRVGLARALVYRPKILLMDEPLSNLDAKLREQMRFEIKDLQDRLGITAIYVTHDQEEALVLSDRLTIMNEGRIHQVGTPEKIYEEPRTEFVADFIGLANFIKGIFDFDSSGQARVSTDIGQLIVSPAPELRDGEEVLILIRPNSIQLKESSGSDENTFNGIIEKEAYLGDKTDYRVRIEDLELRVQMSGPSRFRKGDRVKVHLPTDRCRVIKGQ